MMEFHLFRSTSGPESGFFKVVFMLCLTGFIVYYTYRGSTLAVKLTKWIGIIDLVDTILETLYQLARLDAMYYSPSKLQVLLLFSECLLLFYKAVPIWVFSRILSTKQAAEEETQPE